MARLIETDSFTNKDISAAVSIGSYTATAVRLVHVRVLVNQAAGNGDYIIYATITKSAVEYRVIPITTAAAASGLTSLAFVSLAIPVDVDDVLQVYIDGLAGDNSTPDTRVDFYEKDYLRPTVTGRTLDVSATGEAGLDFDNVKVATGATTLTNITVPVVTTLTNMPAEAPSAATVATQVWTGPDTKQINSVLGTVSANVVQMNGDTDPVDNLVLALGTGGLVEKLNGMLEAAGLAYRFTAEALAEGPVSTAPSTTDIDTALSATHGAGAWGAGTGVFAKVYTVTSGGLPVDGVYCRMTTDEAGLVNVDAGTTNAAGQVTFHHNLPASTTVYIHRSKAGYTPVAPEPDVEVI